MARFNKILVPVDGSPNSIRGLIRAIDVAKPTGAEITALYVFPVNILAGIKYTSKMREDAQRKAAKSVGPAMKKVQQAGVAFKYKTGVGNAGQVIIKSIDQGKFDMVVIGARGLSSAKESFLGSTSHHVIHKAKIPVLIVK
jgi:nucleotide-binding universal stress UspA family protein